MANGYRANSCLIGCSAEQQKYKKNRVDELKENNI